MSKLADEKRRDILKAWALGERYALQPAPLQLIEKSELYSHIVNHIGRDEPITYIEFGVAHGDSIRYFSNHFTHANARFIGFDSFEGLPEPWLHMPRFFFGRNGHEPENADTRVSFIKGWFQNTLHPFFSNFTRPLGTVLIHFDADLYSSTLFAMAMTWPALPPYYFFMDDFQYDDSVALFDFASSFPIDIEFLAQAGRDGLGRLIAGKVFGKLASKPFVPSEGV